MSTPDPHTSVITEALREPRLLAYVDSPKGSAHGVALRVLDEGWTK